MPELGFLSDFSLGYVHKTVKLYVSGMPDEDEHSSIYIHEAVHMADFAVEEQVGGAKFDSRVKA